MKSEKMYPFRPVLLFPVVLVLFMLCLQSCEIDPCGSAPADLVENLEDLVKEVKKVDYKPKDHRWEPYDDRFNTFFDVCYDQWREEMTFDQKRQFTGLVTRYMAHRFGRSFFGSIFGNGDDDDAESSEIFEKLGEELQDFLQDNKESGINFLQELKKSFSSEQDENQK
ncbi:hypothetical protein KUV50_01650 [Membranicola marinus]|uniref:Uncharacterized protein n=1 Tax=Membranihabitans marinus TaxID=1227546 RepID=A0A953HUN8_9BACT|nr:DUF6565 domain-containing protein [Membranihabitans marinus]MBY5956821.1 hypothetical protein [Membranihabitans marinus]